jgi:hypothetical protein
VRIRSTSRADVGSRWHEVTWLIGELTKRHRLTQSGVMPIKPTLDNIAPAIEVPLAVYKALAI